MEELSSTSGEELRSQYAPSKRRCMQAAFLIFIFVSAGGHFCLIHGVPLFLLHPTHGFFLFHYNRERPPHSLQPHPVATVCCRHHTPGQTVPDFSHTRTQLLGMAR